MAKELDKVLNYKKSCQSQVEWDVYLMNLTQAISLKSKCLSRKIGALLVRDNSIIATGYNGPPRGVRHCDERLEEVDINDPLYKELQIGQVYDPTLCPRRHLGYSSGQGLHLCIAAHAERNCISNAAMHGVVTREATLYLNCEAPCKDCMAAVINAGIKHIVCLRKKAYDPLANLMAEDAKVLIREVTL